MQNYFPLIEFNIDHDFFEGGKCLDTEMIFARNEARLKNNFNFFLRRNAPGQYVVYIEQNENFEERSRLLEKDLKEDARLIEFLLIVTNRHFFSYTANAEALAGGKIFDLFVPMETGSPAVFNFSEEQEQCGDASLNELVARKYPSALACITFHFPEGPNDTIYSMVKNKQTLHVTCLFEAKSAYWKYFFIPRAPKEQKIYVTETNHRVEFSAIEWSKMGKDLPVGISYSTEEIKLSERYPFTLQLWEKHHNGQSLLINRLSFPDSANPANFSYDEQKRNFISIYQYF
ncbi:MAG TPA: hypothetical protein PKH79_01165 [Prolixibacteraceae bacterium]|nr:hypothetical protein [Prolixibacteraceae bacterium]